MNKRQAKKKAKKEADRQRDAIEALKKLPGIAEDIKELSKTRKEQKYDNN